MERSERWEVRWSEGERYGIQMEGSERREGYQLVHVFITHLKAIKSYYLCHTREDSARILLRTPIRTITSLIPYKIIPYSLYHAQAGVASYILINVY